MSETNEIFSEQELEQLKNIFNQIDFLEIDFDDLSEDDLELVRSLCSYSKDEKEYSDSSIPIEEMLEKLNEFLDKELLFKIPTDRREEFFNSVNANNLMSLLSEENINEYPELFSMAIKKTLGKKEWDFFYQDKDRMEEFDFLKNCPELSKQIEEFPADEKIDYSHYRFFIDKFNDIILKNAPEKNKEKLLLSFIEKNMTTSIGFLFRISDEEQISNYLKIMFQDEKTKGLLNNGIVFSAISNIDFSKCDINEDELNSIEDFAVENYDVKTIKKLIETYSGIAESALSKYEKILENEDNKDEIQLLSLDYSYNGYKFLSDVLKISKENDEEINSKLIFNIFKKIIPVKFEGEKKDYIKCVSNIKHNSNKIKLVDDLFCNTTDEKVKYYIFTMMEKLLSNSSKEEAIEILEKLPNISEKYLEKHIKDAPSDTKKEWIVQKTLSQDYLYSNLFESINHIRDNTAEPDLKEYYNLIENGQLLDSNNIEDFSKKIFQKRVKDGIIPKEICDYGIKNIILNKDFYLKKGLKLYKLVTALIIDKTRSILKNNGIDDYVVYIKELKEFEYGLNNSKLKEIVFSDDLITYFRMGYNNIINTMFHETDHAIRFRHIENKQIKDKIEYQMIKEDILQIVNEFFYDDNYKNLSTEIVARIAGRQKMYEYLQEQGISIEEILQGDIDYNKELFETYQEFLEEEVESLDDDKREYLDFSEEKGTLNSIFNAIIKDKPELLDFEKYPALKCEYKKDGTRKSALEILEEYEKEMRKEDYVEPEFNLYEYLIEESFKSDEELKREIIEKDSQSISTYKPQTERGREIYNTILENIKKYRDEKSQNDTLQLEETVSCLDGIDSIITPEQRKEGREECSIRIKKEKTQNINTKDGEKNEHRLQ